MPRIRHLNERLSGRQKAEYIYMNNLTAQGSNADPGYYEQLVNYYQGRIHPGDLPAALRNGPVPVGWV